MKESVEKNLKEVVGDVLKGGQRSIEKKVR